jgi:UDP-N-acetyl-D-mannosaminuronic acid transferase (WecB/TagA/CpsF family)
MEQNKSTSRIPILGTTNHKAIADSLAHWQAISYSVTQSKADFVVQAITDSVVQAIADSVMVRQISNAYPVQRLQTGTPLNYLFTPMQAHFVEHLHIYIP